MILFPFVAPRFARRFAPTRKASPIIKPTTYIDKDVLMRKRLVVLNWMLFYNKMMVLHYLKLPPRVTNHSFTIKRPTRRFST